MAAAVTIACVGGVVGTSCTFAVSGNSLASTGADGDDDGGRPCPMGICRDPDGSVTQSGTGPGWRTSGRRGTEGRGAVVEEVDGGENLLAAMTTSTIQDRRRGK